MGANSFLLRVDPFAEGDFWAGKQIGNLNSYLQVVKQVYYPCHAEWIKLPRPFLIFNQSDYLIKIVDINSQNKWQTVRIQISRFLQKPTVLDLHFLQRQGISGFSRTKVKFPFVFQCHDVSVRLTLRCFHDLSNDPISQYLRHSRGPPLEDHMEKQKVWQMSVGSQRNTAILQTSGHFVPWTFC